MENNKLKIVLYSAGLASLVAVLLFFVLNNPFRAGAVTANLSGEPVALIGSRTGTTTTGVNFYVRAASTTYPFRLGPDKTNVTFFISALATTTDLQGGQASISVLASNDDQCDTASTSAGILLTTVTGDITWFDASSNVKDSVGQTSLASSTVVFNFPGLNMAKRRELVLKDLNAKCMALEVSASSSVLYTEFMAK